MTFLEYVCTRLLGPPAYSKGDGESRWECPKCGSAKFHTRPSRPPHKDRFSCWSCAWWGDEADLLRHHYPRDTYDDRLARLAQLHLDHEAAEQDPRPDGGTLLPRGGAGRVKAAVDPRDVERAWAYLTPAEGRLLAAAYAVAKGRCPDDPAALLRYSYDVLEWAAESDRRHFEGCDDPRCDAIVCRAARGLPPLTLEEIDAGRPRPRRSRNGRRGRRTT